MGGHDLEPLVLFRTIAHNLIRMVDELCDGAAVSDATWEELAQVYPEAQLVELLCLAGFYHLVAFLCRAARVPLEPWAERLPG